MPPPPPKQQQQQNHVWVVVLGDFGRSPRMQYHALSLSQQKQCVVDVVAMPGSPPIAALVQAPNVHIHHIPSLPGWAARLPSLPGLLLKALFQLLALLWLMLVRLARPTAILMQNPPAIPSMAVCWLAAARHRAAWVIDWHNTAFSIMQLKYGRHGWLIRLARSIEQWFGARAAAHFCVTKAFKQWLEADFGLGAGTVLVLYDRPPAMFHRCSLRETHALLARLQPALAADGIGTCLQRQLAAAAAAGAGPDSSATTLLTCVQGPQGAPVWRPGRPALVVSSTSWTPDEDFGILLAAAEAYDAAAAAASGSGSTAKGKGSSSSYPDVVFVITGRGPQREMYLSRIRQLSLSKVAFCSMWLEPEDYPLILGAADLGVCLHTSSSGLDLPMKVVDMFGAGLPVCAVDYDCVTELVQPGSTGLLFRTPEELAQQLLDLLRGFSGHADDEDGGQLAGLRAGVAKEQSAWRWQDNWQAVAAPVFAHYASASCGAAGGSSSRQQGVVGSPPPSRKAKKVV